MTCIIHYEGQDKYDELSPITAKTAEKILLAKSMHENNQECDHTDQCKSIPMGRLVDCFYHKNPCYKKFVWVTVKNKSKSSSSLTFEKATANTRAKRKSSDKFVELPVPSKKSNTEEVQVHQTRRKRSLALATSSSRNQHVFGRECVLCGSFELRYKLNQVDIREYPLSLTLDIPAEKIKEQISKKDRYKQLAEKIILIDDLIAAEFKYHDRCRKELMRDERETTSVGRPNAGFKKVLDHIDDYVVKLNQVVSMNQVYDICYGNSSNDASKESVLKRKQRLKKMINDHYGDSILIIGTNVNHPEVIIYARNLDSKVTLNSCKESIIKNAAACLRKDIIEFCSKLPPLSWPPTLEELLSETRLPPPSTIFFLTSLLKSPKHAATERIRRLVNSFAADFVYGVSGELTSKHFLLAHGLHSMSGNKEAVQITNRLGHCTSYDNVLDIETAQAQKAAILMKNGDTSVLPLKPKYPTQIVTTWFWADNLNKNVDKETGGGAIEMTTLMAFQEESFGAIQGKQKINVPKTKSRTISVEFDDNKVTFCSKQEPDITNFKTVENASSDFTHEFSCKYFTWLYLRYSNRLGQIHPNLAGLLLRIRQREFTSQSTPISKTVETYLPPLTTKVTDPQTIFTYLTYFQALAEEMNMPYVNVTLDVGAAMNAYKLLWKYPQQFSNVMIHLGDFHILKENFKIMGLLLKSSGFEEIVYQTRLCTSGSLCGVMSGNHYNRAWRIHEIVSEALERILLKRFLHEVDPDISDELLDLATEEYDLITSHSLHLGESLRQQFHNYQQKVRQGHLGQTAQFWLIYMDMMRIQLQHHTSVQENDFELRLASIESFIPFYFYYNMQNYARYASYYVQMLKSIDTNYPGLKDLLLSTGLSVQSQDRYPLRTAVDMRGEQTLNRDAKTSGGITHFAASASSVQKWAMNRSDAAESKKALRRMVGLSDPNSIYKSLRPLQIINSEQKVASVMNVIENDYINPFGIEVGEDSLLNIGSGLSLPCKVSDEIINQLKKGTQLSENFNNNRLFSSNIKFHVPITRNNCKSFSDSKKTCVINSKSGAQATIEVNRNILGALNSFSLKTGIAVNYKKALAYPLNPCPLSISHADGRKRSNKKSDLKEILIGQMKNLSSEQIQNIRRDAVVVDMMGVVNLITSVPDTYEELAKVFVNNLPKGYRRIDIAADSYGSVRLFKRGENGDQADKILIPSLKSRVHPQYSTTVLKNRDNKARLVELIFEYIERNARACFETLHSAEIVLSSEDKCITIKLSANSVTVNPTPELLSNHDEGDTKVVLHASKILTADPDIVVTIRSPSGDTDIVVLLIVHLHQYGDRVVLDDFHGQEGRKSYRLSDLELEDSVITSLIGLHAFTGNDFVSSFFRKGKSTCFKLLEGSSRFQITFDKLGLEWDLSDDTFDELQSFVLRLYGARKFSGVDEARYRMFKKK